MIGTAWIARLVSHPVRRLTEASRLLADGRLNVRVPASGRGELARLSEVVAHGLRPVIYNLETVLIPTHRYEGTGANMELVADVTWTFPLDFVEVADAAAAEAVTPDAAAHAMDRLLAL